MDCSKTENFLKEWDRMCSSCGSECRGCGISIFFINAGNCQYLVQKNPKKCIELVQKWSDKHQPGIDWSKVPVNTPVLVCDDLDAGMVKRCFIAYEPTYCGGRFFHL